MLNFHFEDEEMKSLAPENISSECWGLDLKPLPCDSKAGLFALLSLSANTEEGTWLGRELPGSWFPEAVGVTFPWGSPSISICGGRKMGGGPPEQSLPGAQGRCQLACLRHRSDYETSSGRALLRHRLTHCQGGSS